MKKKLWSWLVVIGVLFAVLLASPWVMGIVVKNQLIEAIQSFNNQGYAVNLNIAAYQRHWFNSSLVLQLNDNKGNLLINPVAFSIHHGPLIKIDDSWHLAMGSFESKITDSRNTGKIKGSIALNYELSSTIDINLVTMQQPFGKVQLDQTQIKFAYLLNAQNHASAGIKFTSLAIQNDQDKIVVNDFNVNMQNDLVTKTSLLVLSADKLCYDNICIQNVNSHIVAKQFAVEKLNPQLIEDLQKTIDQFVDDDKPMRYQVLANKISPAISSNSRLEFSINFDSMKGPVSFNSEFSWPNYQNNEDVINKLKIHSILILPTFFLDRILQQRNNLPDVSYPNSMNLPVSSKIANLLQQWIDNDYMIRYGAQYQIPIEMEKQTIKFNDKVFDKLNYAYLLFVLGHYQDSFKEFMNLAQTNDALAQYYVGLQYAFGLGMNKNEQLAVKWLTNSADQHTAAAALLLAGLYNDHLQSLNDYQQAIYWLQYAANLHNPIAETALAALYVEGDQAFQIKPDYQKAVYWLRLAVAQDYSIAQYRLGKLYENGMGVDKDINRAYVLYLKAARNVPEAKEALSRLKSTKQ